MKLEVLSVYDRAMKGYGRPMFVVAVGVAIRGFSDEINSKDSELGKHPEDYDLFHIGEWDDESARYIQFDLPRCVLTGKSALREVKRVS